jgi:hypothetical protein
MNIFARFSILTTSSILTTLLVATALLTNCSSSEDDPADTSTSDVVAADDVVGDDILPAEDILLDEDIIPTGDIAVPDEDIVDREEDAVELVEEVVESASLLADFEDLGLTEESYWDGADGTGLFVSGQLSFINLFNQEFMSWDGYSYSNITDNTTPGYDNQFSAIPGGGADDTATYVLAHDGTGYGAQAPTFIIDFEMPIVLDGAYVTNATYTYLSMAEGDDFAKKFGGVDGTDPDFFMITFTGYDNDGKETGTVEFYLADFQSETAADDYIISEWTWVDLTALGDVGEVRAVLSSSDTGEWGMNTPAYFAIDQIFALEL